MKFKLRILLAFAAFAAAAIQPLRAEDLKQQYDRIRVAFDAEIDKAGESHAEQKKIIRKYALDFFKFGDANKGELADQALIESAVYYSMANDTPGVDTAMTAAMKRALSWDSKMLLLQASKDIPSRKPQAKTLATGMMDEGAADPVKAGQLAPILDGLKLSNEAEEMREIVIEARTKKSAAPGKADKPAMKDSAAVAPDRKAAAPLSGKVVQTGRNLSLSSLKGKVVLLDFWATWCGPCIAELPAVKQIYSTYHSKGLEIIGISLDQKLDTLTSFIEKQKMAWPQIADTINEGDRIAGAYGINSIPMTYLIDRQGRVAAMDLRGQALADAVAALIAER